MLRGSENYRGPPELPPKSFQLRTRKETDVRDTTNARLIESWNANTPIQQSVYVQTHTNSGFYFDPYIDVYRAPSASEGQQIIASIPDYVVPTAIPDPKVPYEQSPLYAYIQAFMAGIEAYDTKNKLYMVGALKDVFETQTDRKDFINISIEKEKAAILSLVKATYIDPTFSAKSVADKIRILKTATLEAFHVQRTKNVDGITHKVNVALDSGKPETLDAVHQDMAPLSSRQDLRDFRQSKPYDSSGPNLSLNPFFDRYDPTRDPRNMVREVRSAVYEPKEGDRGIQESERIRARTFTNRYVPESETPVALTEWFNLLRPKIDNPEVVYRNQNATWSLGSPLE